MGPYVDAGQPSGVRAETGLPAAWRAGLPAGMSQGLETVPLPWVLNRVPGMLAAESC